MAKKIVIDIEVNGKMQKATVSAKKLNQALKNTETSAHTADRRLKGAAQASANGAKNFSKMAQGITGGLVPAYATLAANIFAVSAAFNFLKNAAQFKLLEQAQASYFASTGTNLKSISRDLQEASNGFLNFESAAQAAAVGAAKGFTTADLESLVDGALVASAALGRSFQDSFDRLLRGVSKAEPELLDELGIILRLETATKKYAQANNLAVKSLTAYERGRAVLEEVQEQLKDNFGAINSANIKNPFEELAVTFDEIVKKFSKAILPVFEAFATIVNNSAYAAIAVFGLFGLSIAKAAFPLEEMGSLMEDFDSKTQNMSTNMTAGLDRVQAEIQQTKQGFEGLKAGASMNVQKFSTMQGNKTGSKILQKAATDPASLTKKDKAQLARSLKAAEAQYKKHGKIKTGIFKAASAEELAIFKKDLKLMDQQKMRFYQRINLGWKNAGANAKLYGVGARKMLSGLVGFAGKVGKGIGGALSKGIAMAGIFGIITMVVQAFMYLMKNIHSITLNILGFLDSFMQSGVGKAFSTIINGLITGVKMFIEITAGRFADLIGGVTSAMASALEFLGADELAEKIRGVGAMPAQLVDAATAGLDKAISKISSISSGESSLVTQFADSDVGQRMASFEGEFKARDQRNKLLGDEAEKVKELTEAVRALNEQRKEMTLTGFQKEMASNRLISTTGVSSRLLALSDATQAEKISRKGSFEELLKEMTRDGAAPQLEELYQTLVNMSATDFATGGLESLASSIAAQEEKSASLVANYKDYNEQLDKAANLAPTAFRSFDNLDTNIHQMKILRKSLSDAAEGSEVVDEKLRQAFKDATGQQIDAFTEKLIAFRAEFDRVREGGQEIALDTVIAQGMTGFAKEDMLERLKLKQMENELDRINLEIKLARADLDSTDAGDPERQKILDRIDGYMQEKAILKEKRTQAKEDLTLIGALGDTIGESFQTSMQTAFQSLVEGTMTAKQAFASMAQSILKDIAAMITKMLVLKLIESSLGGTSFGNFLGVSNPKLSSGPANPTGYGSIDEFFRYGGISKTPAGYSTGGVAKGPQAGYPAVLHGTEAVVPLPNGKSIPVHMKGAGQQNNVTVNVAIDGQGNARQDKQADSNEGANLGSAIAAAVQKELHNQKRAGGILNPIGVS